MATVARARLRDYFSRINLPFWIAHLLAVACLFWVGWSWSALGWTALVYAIGMFFVTAGYHRYFSHRSYKTSRWFQLVLAFAQATAQKGVLWWASRHRHHHRTSDTEDDVHSAAHRGFLWSHMGWFLADENKATNVGEVRDLATYPELRLLNRYGIDVLPAVAYALIIYLVGGVRGLAYAAFLPVVLIWHGTFLINSLAHIIGSQRYDTGEHSKNNPVLALITLGEGWHNNHHHYQRSCRQGFRWWELDITYMVLCALSALGLVWDVSTAPRSVIERVASRRPGPATGRASSAARPGPESAAG
jgi:stearoyl-CoA desaturase (delta-9 desaturase)